MSLTFWPADIVAWIFVGHGYVGKPCEQRRHRKNSCFLFILFEGVDINIPRCKYYREPKWNPQNPCVWDGKRMVRYGDHGVLIDVKR